MAIRIRRGSYNDFDKNKLLPGEIAVVMSNDPNVPDGKTIYACLGTGDVKRFATIEELETLLSLSHGQYALLAESIKALQGNTSVMVDLNNRVNIVEAEIAGIHSDMSGATTGAAGVHGLVPAPAAGAANRFLRSDGTWVVVDISLVTEADIEAM